MEFKKCVKCEITKTNESFDKTRAKCKQCRAGMNKDYYNDSKKNTRLAEREIKRKEFFKILEQRCIDDKTEFDFRHIFLEEELLALMRLKTDLYSFCEVPEQIADDIRKTDDFKVGYVLKHIWITNNLKRTMFVKIIV